MKVFAPALPPFRIVRKSLGASVGLALMAFAGSAAGQAPSYYDVQVLNNFGNGEYFGATPTNSNIWLLTNFQFDYKSGGNYTTGSSTSGSWNYVNLNDVQEGKLRVYTAGSNGTRMYAVLSPTAPPTTQLSPSNAIPYNYFEWSFASGTGNPGTLDLSWIDNWDFHTRMVVSATGTQTPAPTTVTYGSGSTSSTKATSDAIQSYANQSGGNFSWLNTYKQSLSLPGTTSTPTRWITKNSDPTVDASQIQSFTNAISRINSQSSNSTAWVSGTPATGPNWTTAGFRVGSLQPLNPPDGSTLPGNATATAWSAYVNFSSNNTMTLTDFTVYSAGPGGSGGSNVVAWNAGNATYSVTQAEGGLNAIWNSTNNSLSSPPAWVANLGGNAPNLWYAIYNAIATGVVFQSDFLNNTALPGSITGDGYVPYVAGQNTYNFEVLTKGAQVTGGLAGELSGSDLIALMQLESGNGTLVNPYFLELLQTAQQTPAYLFPSQDFWGYQSTGSNTEIGIQTGPLNGLPVFGQDATLTWYLGSGAAIPEPGTMALMGFAAGFFALLVCRRSRRATSGRT